MSIAPGDRLEGLASPAKRRRNKDGSAVCCLQLAHSERHAGTGSPAVKVQGHPRLRARRPAGWKLNSCVLVCGSGLNAAATRTSLQEGGGLSIVAERLRSAAKHVQSALARPGPTSTPRLQGATATCARTSSRAWRCASEAHRRTDSLAKQRRDELAGELRATPAVYRLLRRNNDGRLRVDRAAVADEACFDARCVAWSPPLSPGPRRCRLVTAAVWAGRVPVISGSPGLTRGLALGGRRGNSEAAGSNREQQGATVPQRARYCNRCPLAISGGARYKYGKRRGCAAGVGAV